MTSVGVVQSATSDDGEHSAYRRAIRGDLNGGPPNSNSGKNSSSVCRVAAIRPSLTFSSAIGQNSDALGLRYARACTYVSVCVRCVVRMQRGLLHDSHAVVGARTVEDSVMVYETLVAALVEIRLAISSVDQVDHISSEGCT